jgi:hypothetical protein
MMTRKRKRKETVSYDKLGVTSSEFCYRPSNIHFSGRSDLKRDEIDLLKENHSTVLDRIMKMKNKTEFKFKFLLPSRYSDVVLRN